MIPGHEYHFQVEFGKDSVKFNITGLAKGMNTVTNKVKTISEPGPKLYAVAEKI